MQRATFLTICASLAVPNITVYAKTLTLTEQYKRTTKEQRELIRKLYEKGKKYNLENTLVVIAWKESSFGIQLTNDRGEWSGGVLGLSYWHTAIRHFNTQRPIPEQILYIEKRLKKDLDFSIKHAVIHLQRGIGKFGNDWMKVWAYYNGGNKYWASDEAKKYAKDFNKKVRIIKRIGVL